MTTQEVKEKLLKASFTVVPFYKWSDEALYKIDEKAGYKKGTHKFFFPNGASDFIDFFHMQLDELIVAQMKLKDIRGVKNSIFNALCIRFEEYQKRRPFSIISNQHMCTPSNILLSKKIAWRTVDSIWANIAMDRSTDFNYYTKRGLLFCVYNLASLYWISDETIDLSDTKDFIMRRLDNTVTIGMKVKSILKA